MIYLIGYFLFGAGYIAYMTFMIAYVRDAGGGAAAQSAFWSLIGISAFVTPWVWRRVLALDRGGLTTAIILGVNAVGAALPIFGHSVWLLALSALVFGVAFFAVVGSTTAFVRFNYPPQAWPVAIAAMTISFGIGQTLGPIVVGAITDAVGSLSFALNISAAMRHWRGAVGVSEQGGAENGCRMGELSAKPSMLPTEDDGFLGQYAGGNPLGSLHSLPYRLVVRSEKMEMQGMTYFDLGPYSRKITTSSPEAQLWFDRGLNWLFGFNHAEAIKCFQKALGHDGECAMAHWGSATPRARTTICRGCATTRTAGRWRCRHLTMRCRQRLRMPEKPRRSSRR